MDRREGETFAQQQSRHRREMDLAMAPENFREGCRVKREGGLKALDLWIDRLVRWDDLRIRRERRLSEPRRLP